MSLEHPLAPPKVIITPSTPLPSSPQTQNRSPPQCRKARFDRHRSVFEGLERDNRHHSPTHRAFRERPRSHSVVVSFVFLLLATLLVSSSLISIAPCNLLTAPDLDRMFPSVSRAMQVRMRLALDVRHRQSISTTLQNLMQRDDRSPSSTQSTFSVAAGDSATFHQSDDSEGIRIGIFKSDDAWKANLRKSEMVLGLLESESTIEAWDFH